MAFPAESYNRVRTVPSPPEEMVRGIRVPKIVDNVPEVVGGYFPWSRVCVCVTPGVQACRLARHFSGAPRLNQTYARDRCTPSEHLLLGGTSGARAGVNVCVHFFAYFCRTEKTGW